MVNFCVLCVYFRFGFGVFKLILAAIMGRGGGGKVKNLPTPPPTHSLSRRSLYEGKGFLYWKFVRGKKVKNRRWVEPQRLVCFEWQAIYRCNCSFMERIFSVFVI